MIVNAPSIIASGFASLLTAAAIAAPPPPATVRLQVDGAPSARISASGEWLDEREGLAQYSGFIEAADRSWTLEWNVVVDTTGADGTLSLDGEITVHNHAGGPGSSGPGPVKEFLATFDVRVFDAAASSTSIGGQSAIEVTADDAGGSLACGTDASFITTYLLDGAEAQGVWSSLTSLELEEAGTSAMSQVFGWPFPQNAKIGPGVHSKVGVAHAFELTGGDSVSFDNLFLIELP